MSNIVYVQRTAKEDKKNYPIKKGDIFYLGFDKENDDVDFYDKDKNIMYPTDE